MWWRRSGNVLPSPTVLATARSTTHRTNTCSSTNTGKPSTFSNKRYRHMQRAPAFRRGSPLHRRKRRENLNRLEEMTDANVFVRGVLVVVEIHDRETDCRQREGFAEDPERQA